MTDSTHTVAHRRRRNADIHAVDQGKPLFSKLRTGGAETSAYARANDRDTSHIAAASIRMTDLENTVLSALRSFPCGATSYQLAEGLALSLVTVSPRMRPLVTKGLVKDSGRRVTGQSGRPQTVWIAVEPAAK